MCLPEMNGLKALRNHCLFQWRDRIKLELLLTLLLIVDLLNSHLSFSRANLGIDVLNNGV